MDKLNDLPLEYHLHGDVPLRREVSYNQLQDALRPIWTYAGATSLLQGAASAYEEEPGIRMDETESVLRMCWTVSGDQDFRNCLDEMCMNLNELAACGASIEVSVFDAEFDEDEDDNDPAQSRDDFLMLFVGPTPGDIMQAQRDLLIEDVTALMERHFDKTEMGGVFGEIDNMFTKRYDAMVNSLVIPRSMRPASSGHNGPGRKPRHLH